MRKTADLAKMDWPEFLSAVKVEMHKLGWSLDWCTAVTLEDVETGWICGDTPEKCAEEIHELWCEMG